MYGGSRGGSGGGVGLATVEADDETLNRVRTHAFQRLSWQERQSTNLYINREVLLSGEYVGPERQQITIERPSILVFADEAPRANFAHPCRYFLYEADEGVFYRDVSAQFPPFNRKPPESLEPFHLPVQFFSSPSLFKVVPIFRCPILVERKRYAILYSGMSNVRHLNDLEFLYRTLVDRYGFDPADIYVLHYDGSLDTQDGLQTVWPGDDTPYRIHITNEGTQEAFESVIDELKHRIDADDLLLIHTNNHGAYDGAPGTANLCTYPNWEGHYADDFTRKLSELPAFSQLVVMMEQCHAGGFNDLILAKSPAHATSIASAATEPSSSWATADGMWDQFARDWIAAQAGHDPFGAALAFNPDADGDGLIEAEEAFAYANAIRTPLDTPNFSKSSQEGAEISLGREYVVWWWWCVLLRGVLEPYYLALPGPDYYERLRKIQPLLASLASELDAQSATLRGEFEPRLNSLVTQAFGTP